MGLFGIVLILVIIFSLLAIGYITIYNKIQYGNTKIEHVEGLIDEDLRQKFDIILRADNVIRENLKTKKDYLKEFIHLKDKEISNFDLDRKLKEAENIIINLYNDNQELNSNENMKQMMEEFKIVNEKLIAGISYYNKQTNIKNAYIRKFPNNIIAMIHKSKVKPFFDQKDMTDDNVNDFKF